MLFQQNKIQRMYILSLSLLGGLPNQSKLEDDEATAVTRMMSTLSGQCIATLIESKAYLKLFPPQYHTSSSPTSPQNTSTDLNPFLQRGNTMLPSSFAPSTVDGTLFGQTTDHTRERREAGLFAAIRKDRQVYIYI